MQANILWNAPLHSWTGVASEAVDFLVPLALRLPNLGLVGMRLLKNPLIQKKTEIHSLSSGSFILTEQALKC